MWLLSSEVNFLLCLIYKLYIHFSSYVDIGKTVFIWFSTTYGFRHPLGFLACVPIKTGTLLYVQLGHPHTEKQETLVFDMPFPLAALEEPFLVLFSVLPAP